MRNLIPWSLLLAGLAAPALGAPAPLIDIPAGNYRPLFPGKDQPRLQPVSAFRLQRHAVTNADFVAFVTAKLKWSRGHIKALFTDENYLQHWAPPSAAKSLTNRTPVVRISFFAAQAYCEWKGLRLPSTAEWEYVGAASETSRYGRDEPKYNAKILEWYGRPTGGDLAAVEAGKPNAFGVHDMHGLVWEWTSDFNSVLVTGESRGDSALERALYCGSGALGSVDPSDYAAFMRTAFRSSIDGRYTGTGLGFRCAADR